VTLTGLRNWIELAAARDIVHVRKRRTPLAKLTRNERHQRRISMRLRRFTI
jgi:hypothetical protein